MADPYTVTSVESDPIFELTERLYRRIPLAEIETGTIADTSIPSPAFSVAREKYLDNPADVLKGYPGQGLAEFRVGDIPSSIEANDGRLYEFGVEHRPLHNDRSHSEVHSYHNGARLQELDKEPPRHVRKKFRDLLRQKMKILPLRPTEY